MSMDDAAVLGHHHSIQRCRAEPVIPTNELDQLVECLIAETSNRSISDELRSNESDLTDRHHGSVQGVSSNCDVNQLVGQHTRGRRSSGAVRDQVKRRCGGRLNRHTSRNLITCLGQQGCQFPRTRWYEGQETKPAVADHRFFGAQQGLQPFARVSRHALVRSDVGGRVPERNGKADS